MPPLPRHRPATQREVSLSQISRQLSHRRLDNSVADIKISHSDQRRLLDNSVTDLRRDAEIAQHLQRVAASLPRLARHTVEQPRRPVAPCSAVARDRVNVDQTSVHNVPATCQANQCQSVSCAVSILIWLSS